MNFEEELKLEEKLKVKNGIKIMKPKDWETPSISKEVISKCPDGDKKEVQFIQKNYEDFKQEFIDLLKDYKVDDISAT